MKIHVFILISPRDPIYVNFLSLKKKVKYSKKIIIIASNSNRKIMSELIYIYVML